MRMFRQARTTRIVGGLAAGAVVLAACGGGGANEPQNSDGSLTAFKTIADIEYATAGWVDWYDNRRLRSSLVL